MLPTKLAPKIFVVKLVFIVEGDQSFSDGLTTEILVAV